MTPRCRAALTIGAIVAAAAFAPASAGATSRIDKYAGPVDQATAPAACLYCGTGSPHLELAVHLKSKHRGSSKFKPDKISWLKFHNVWFTCEHVEGYGDYLSAGSGHGGGTDYVLRYDKTVKVKKRKFSIDDSDEGLTMAGQVPRSGAATGTLRFAVHQSAYGSGDTYFPGRDCDSGVLGWTADPL